MRRNNKNKELRKKINLKLDTEVYCLIKEKAQGEHKSMNAVMTNILQEYVDLHNNEESLV